MTLLGLVVVGVDLGAKLLFLDDGLLLVLARLARLLSRLVLELAVVHDLADRRSGVRGYFDKVEIGVRGDAESVFDAHDAYLLAAGSDQSDFRYADALVDAGLSADGASLVRSYSVVAIAFLSGVREDSSRGLAVSTPSAKRPCMVQGPIPTDHG